MEQDVSTAVIRRALQGGVNYIDTAPYYGQGRSEEAIGEALIEWLHPLDKARFIARRVPRLERVAVNFEFAEILQRVAVALGADGDECFHDFTEWLPSNKKAPRPEWIRARGGVVWRGCTFMRPR